MKRTIELIVLGGLLAFIVAMVAPNAQTPEEVNRMSVDWPVSE
ncbi:hypothetical protein [Sinorhizobium sp. BG8]|nr:hypothetical protein [Sinorhizobium sp. BG8]